MGHMRVTIEVMSLVVAAVTQAVCGLALSCRNMTPFWTIQQCFWSHIMSQVIHEDVAKWPWSSGKYNALLVVLDDPRIAAESLFAQMLLFYFCLLALFLSGWKLSAWPLLAGAVCFSRSSCSTLFCCGSSGLCLGIFDSVQKSHLLQQVIMFHFVLLWKFWLVSRHLSFCSGVTFSAAGRFAPLSFAVEVLACVWASFLLFRIQLSRHQPCGWSGVLGYDYSPTWWPLCSP